MSAADSFGRPVRPKFAPTEHAFPREHGSHGMALREYFAAHAPEVPAWFPHEPLPPEGLPITEALRQQPLYKDLTHHDLEALRQSVVDDEFEILGLHTRLAEVAAAANELHHSTWKVRLDAERALPERRFFKWRWYYADQMLAGRSA